MGFANYLVTKTGNLVRTFIQSPNFVSGSTGWQIAKDGSAEFSNLTIRGTFHGSDFIINSAGYFEYSGTPAAGNLVYSNTSGAGSDGFSNNYLAGETGYNNSSLIALNISSAILNWYTFTGQPSAVFTVVANLGLTHTAGGSPVYGITVSNLLQILGTNTAESVIQNDALAILNYTATGNVNADGNTYGIGHLINAATATPQVFTGNTLAQVTGCTASVAIRSYKFRAVLQFTGGQASGMAELGFSGPSASVQWVSGQVFSGTTFGSGQQSAALNTVNSPTLTTSAWTAFLEGFATFTAAGTLAVVGKTSAASGVSFTVQHANFELWPV